ncbi:MAG TPA: sigma-54 dependent transcriptional regulator [Candidatus Polarisedimenticolaceae bacterium]|nr:sigma-54 dependent transcriptional regulator [Candidatus Polarisedimenticolaceae bacterium]
MPHALIVDDERHSLDGVAEWVRQEGFEVKTAASVAQARAAIDGRPIDLALVDLRLPDGSGLDIIAALKEIPEIEIVVITGHGSIDSAIEALHRGATDYLTKPLDLTRLGKILVKVQHTLGLREQVSDLRGQLRRLGRFGCLIGASPVMQQSYDLIARVAPTSSTVFLTGETGVGKELAARMVHELSRRSKRPFIALNCGAVPPNLIESELFGHEKGSFTGAERQRKGIFEQADGGTLLLDEITEMPAELQVKLLRVLETASFTRIGGEELHQIDLRVVAATNRDPAQAVRDGKLREDLLYRLHVFPISLPPLRERGEDVVLLANYFLEQLNREAEVSKRFTDAALDKLRLHGWPGNVRELKNVVERAFILAGDRVDAEHVPLGEASTPRKETNGGNGLSIAVGASLEEAEKELILATLERVGGSRRRAAEILKISLKTLYNRLKAYGI